MVCHNTEPSRVLPRPICAIITSALYSGILPLITRSIFASWREVREERKIIHETQSLLGTVQGTPLGFCPGNPEMQFNLTQISLASALPTAYRSWAHLESTVVPLTCSCLSELQGGQLVRFQGYYMCSSTPSFTKHWVWAIPFHRAFFYLFPHLQKLKNYHLHLIRTLWELKEAMWVK